MGGWREVFTTGVSISCRNQNAIVEVLQSTMRDSARFDFGFWRVGDYIAFTVLTVVFSRLTHMF